MKLGVNTVLFAGYDLNTALELIKFCDYNGAELSSIPGMVEHLTSDASDQELDEIRNKAAELELELYAVEAAGNILLEEQRDRVKRVFERAAKLGIPYVTTGSGGQSEDEESWEQSIQAVVELAQAAQDAGVTYALKLHYGQSIYNTATAQRFLKEVQHPPLGFNYDATHVGRVGDDPVACLEALKDHIIHIHIRDTLIEQLQIAPPELQTAGRGTTPLPAIVDKIVEIGYDGAVNLEIIGAKEYSLPQVTAIAAESRGYFRRLYEEAERKL